MLIIILSGIIGIVEILVSQMNPNDCNLTDGITGMTSRNFLLGSGIVNIIECGVFLILYISEEVFLILYISEELFLLLRGVSLLRALKWFNFIWLIFGYFVVLSNTTCLKEQSLPALGALIAWCIIIVINCF